MNYLLLLLLAQLTKLGSSQLQFTQSNTFTLIWSSRLEASIDIMSLWRPEQEEGFFLLGDVASSEDIHHTKSAILVRGTRKIDVAQPLSSTKVWTNRGSVSGVEVSVHRLSAPHGYRCLGMVVVIGFNTDPDLKMYRCILNDYVVQGTTKNIWRDMTSSIYMRREVDVIVAVEDSLTCGLNCGHFQISMFRTTSPVWLLCTDHLIMSSTDESTAGTDILKVLTVGSGTSIWLDDKTNTAIFNPQRRNTEFYSGGSYLEEPESEHKSYLFSGALGRSLDFPLYYTLIHSETTPIPLYLWQPLCRDAYRSLGLYATNVDKVPVNETVCVNEKFTFSTSSTWTLARWDSNWENVLWEAGKLHHSLDMKFFTYTSSLKVAPTSNPSLLSLETVQFIKQNYLTTYQLSRIRIMENYSVTSCSRGIRNDTATTPRKLKVTSRWWLKGKDFTPGIPLRVFVAQMSERYRYQDIISAAAQTAPSVNVYYTFPYLDTLDEFTAATTYLETWLDVRFKGVLTSLNENEDVLTTSQISGVLNVVVMDLLQDEQ